MRRFIVFGLFIVVSVAIAIISYPARGTCDSGIRKEHLDATAGTIELFSGVELWSGSHI